MGISRERIDDSDWKYKDRIRHGGKREELLLKMGSVCSMCCEEKEMEKIHTHHLIDKQDHRFQVLLCSSCHGKLNVGDKKPISFFVIEETIESSKNLKEVASKLGLSKAGLYKKRMKYGFMTRECDFCHKDFLPNEDLHHYCSPECSIKGKFEKWKLRQEQYRKDGRKSANDKKYREGVHRAELLLKKKEWQEKNKDRLREYRKEYHLKRKALRQNS